MINKSNDTITNTSHRIVLPFYTYAALCFLLGTILLFTSSSSFSGHHFHPHLLTITHIMALGWGTMMILGASYQLVPVLIEESLHSERLAMLSFIIAAIGIPFLLSGFYTFNMGFPAITGGTLVVLAIVLYLINIGFTISKSRKENVHAVFIFTATIWLLLTTLAGLLLVINFTSVILPADSLSYLSLHAHLGIGGWFLLLIIGVGSRLIPMFLISKYENNRLLWLIFLLINAAIIIFTIIHLYALNPFFYVIPLAFVLMSLCSFGFFIYRSFKRRIRRQVDEPMKMALGSVFILALPVMMLLILLIILLLSGKDHRLIIIYGFILFFGWITAIIFGMTFKTLPFIVWNKIYHKKQGIEKTPNPKDLFNDQIFGWMNKCYTTGFGLFIVGLLLSNTILLQMAAGLLVCAALLYNWNVFKMILHK